MSTTTDSRTGRLAGRSELGVALLLGVVGVVVLVDALRLNTPTTDSDRVGPQAFPITVAVLLLVCAVLLAVQVLRGGHGQAEEGEDVDLSAPTEWRVVLPLLGVFVANVLLIDVLGWVVSGTMLFFGCAWSLGSRHYVRDLAISLAMALVTFYGFYLGLGIHLPAGVLEGVLMDTWASLMGGFASALTPENLLYALVGVLLGTAVGVLPGLGPAMTVALLLPVTFALPPESAFIMFAGIYYGGMYGGSTTSILLNTPGESSSVVTAIEGHKMAKAGRAAQALATAAIGSFIAGTIGTALLVVFAPVVVKFAVSLGNPSYFAIMILALFAVTAVLGSSRLRGFCALGLGLTIGLVGTDPVSGQQRLTFGQPLLVDGIDVVVVAVAIFAVGEALWVAAHLRRTAAHVIPVGQPWMGKSDWKRSWKPWLRGTAFGFPFGALPAGGAEIPTFLSYVTEKRLSKHPEEFGHGAIEGVAGPEAANNASAAGTLVPMLSLGLPTNATAAVMLAAFTQYGIQPGPLLFEREPTLVWALIASLFIGNTLLLVINLPLAPAWARLLQIPRPYLYAGIVFFATLGAYSVNLQAFDLAILLVLGLLGFMMRRYGLPVLPLVLGVILGPRLEKELRTSLQLSEGHISGLWSEPVAVVVYAVVALVLLWPLVTRLRGVNASRTEAITEASADDSADDSEQTKVNR